MKPEQPGHDSYEPKTSYPVPFHFRWKTFRVNPQNLGPDFPFRLALDSENRYPVRFLEFRSPHDPPPDVGYPGDIWLNVSPTEYALFALNAQREWVRWSGPRTATIRHPYLATYALWCTIKQASWYHADKLARDWTADKLVARRELGGYTGAEDLHNPAVGVRLILLHEEMEERSSAEDGVTTIERQIKSALDMNLPELGVRDEMEKNWLAEHGVTALEQQLKSALGEIPPKLPELIVPLVSTLTTGIDYLLHDRRKLARALFKAEERAALAEAALKNQSSSKDYYRAHCYAPTSASESQTPAPDTPLSPQSSPTTFPLSLDDQYPLSRADGLTPEHLSILFEPASSNCRLCLELIPTHALAAHALGRHPAECAVFAAASEEQLEGARAALMEGGFGADDSD
ncbi:hypothetical protein C8R46DRAFT_1031299 [Mycena filopes]|nr:hypothetical protein C8R46DRAFT_1031299 [Mycena filopes]